MKITMTNCIDITKEPLTSRYFQPHCFVPIIENLSRKYQPYIRGEESKLLSFVHVHHLLTLSSTGKQWLIRHAYIRINCLWLSSKLLFIFRGWKKFRKSTSMAPKLRVSRVSPANPQDFLPQTTAQPTLLRITAGTWSPSHPGALPRVTKILLWF